ncbi:hypothetical protein PISMIDRAFT_13273 [Pisolithus microcarpus 441]|uniref:Uncharacterized protein n=1 Tax=Pisolithus microcarpus 441 TaxID=765257 RepID=A0A0C9ZJ92_9AGAM|nr:hypothetical protein PISMIDRAFT_13273 [Pisolithus microcarpus 441]
MASATEQSNKESPSASAQEDPTILESAEANRASTIMLGEAPGFLSAVCKGYKSDSVLAKVMAQPSHYPQFEEEGGLLYTKNHGGEKVLCLPHTKYEGDNTIAKWIISTDGIGGQNLAGKWTSSVKHVQYVRR